MASILSIDQGTTGTTCLVIDEKGAVAGRSYAEFTQHYPEAGWVEHDGEELWQVTLRACRSALTAAGLGGARSGELVGIGIANQRETVLLWDRRTGTPLHRAIVWQDRRTAGRCRELKESGLGPMLRRKTGLVPDPYFSATKLEWLLARIPGAATRAAAGELAAGTVDSWLIWKLTDGKVHATEPTNASRTMLFDIASGRWDPDLLDLFGVPSRILPEVCPSSGIFGETDPDLFGSAIPIAGVAGDQQAALFGQGCWAAGMAKNTYGTGAFLLLHTGARAIASRHGLLTTIACGPRGERAFALEGSIFVAGAAVQWLRDELRIIDDAAESETLARSLDSNDGVFFVPAFVGLGAPHWETEARGTIFGLTRGAGRAHLARAALEAIAYSTRDVLQAMVADSGVEVRELAVDGGASQNDWLLQFQADILGCRVLRPQMVESTALGAAGLAGIALGIWPDAEAFLRARPPASGFEPAMPAAMRKQLVAGWNRALHAARGWAEAGQAIQPESQIHG